MNPIARLDLPAAFKFDSVEKNTFGVTNDVYFAKGALDGRAVSAYIKVNKDPQLSLSNEREILGALAGKGFSVPAVLWYGGKQKDVLVVEAMPGRMIWDYIDPRRSHYDAPKAISYLHVYGECLARIHGLLLTWPPQIRSRLHGLIWEENVADKRFKRLVSWVKSNARVPSEKVFVHGDFNTASVLFDQDSISGILDWEFAGTGWREYDLAWALRARKAFLNTPAEREAILNGYRAHARYDETALRFCEVLNYLHFAHWNNDRDSTDTSFILDRAMCMAGLS